MELGELAIFQGNLKSQVSALLPFKDTAKGHCNLRFKLSTNLKRLASFYSLTTNYVRS